MVGNPGQATVDVGHHKLDELAKTFDTLRLHDSSEAETRLKVIDHVLRDVLGWQEGDTTVEEHSSEDGATSFADYVLRTSTTGIIVEAKKAGEAFLLPNDRKSLKLGGVLTEGPVGEAIRQVRDYCRAKNLQFAVATNGAAWVVFPALRTDGVEFENTQARIFRSIEDIQDRFVEFWELLSRQRVIDGNLENELLGSPRETSANRGLSLISEPGYRLGRNAVYEHIEPAVEAAFTDEALLNAPAALEACYVKSSERVKFDSRIQMHLRDVKPPLGLPVERPRRRATAALDNKLAAAPTVAPRLILVLGPVGAGKTTFLQYTRYISAAEIINGNILWYYISFKPATKIDSPRAFIYSALLEQIEAADEFELGNWEHSIRPAYRDLIERLKAGAMQPIAKQSPELFEIEISKLIQAERAEIVPYVERILRRAITQRPAFLVLDNVDQIEDDAFQNAVFSEANAIARKVGINVILSLRDATYLKGRDSPAFDAFQVDALYIDPPQVLSVLSHRFAYGKKLLEGKSAEVLSEHGLRFKVDNLSVFFDLVSTSLLSGDTGYMLEALSGGDIRRGLDYVRAFLSSGHTSADFALKTFLSEGRYSIPRHEVFKAVVLGQRKFYREEESLLPNIFDAKLNTLGLQPMRLQLISGLVGSASTGDFEGTSIESLLDIFHTIGAPSQPTQDCVSRLVLTRILRTADGLPFGPHSVLLPTRLAGFLLREFSWSFQYLEMCALDSMIYDQEAWARFAELTADINQPQDMHSRIELRLERVRVFLKYVERAEERWIVEYRRRREEEHWAHSVVASEITKPFEEVEVPRLLRSVERSTSSRKTGPRPPPPRR